MNNEKIDKRVRQTRRKLREVLLSSLTEKQLREITVKELCERAGINRGTFYLHYRDVYDLFVQVQDEIFEEINAFIEQNQTPEDFSENNTTYSVLLGIFRYLDVNRQLLSVLLGINRDQAFFDRLTNIRREESVRYWSAEYRCTVALTQSFYTYAVSGCVALLKQWLDAGMQTSIDEVAACAARFFRGSISALAQ